MSVSIFKALIKNVDVPEQLRNKLAEISANEILTFEDVKVYLDLVSIDTLRKLSIDVDEIISASGGITEEEAATKRIFIEYLEGRANE